MQRRGCAVEPVEVANPALNAGVQRVLQHVPLEALFVAPLAPLSEFPAHEEQFLAGVRPHVTKEQSQACELLPLISGHLANE